MSEDDANLQSWIEPDLEARIVAAVLGEASAFEVAELARLMGEKPELAIFRRRMEAVHGLVASAAKPDAEPLRLSTGRRENLLEALGQGQKPDEAQPVAMPVEKPRSRSFVRASLGIAALLMVLGLLFPSLQSSKNAARRQLSDERRPQDFGFPEAQQGPVAATSAPTGSEESGQMEFSAKSGEVKQARPVAAPSPPSIVTAPMPVERAMPAPAGPPSQTFALETDQKPVDSLATAVKSDTGLVSDLKKEAKEEDADQTAIAATASNLDVAKSFTGVTTLNGGTLSIDNSLRATAAPPTAAPADGYEKAMRSKDAEDSSSGRLEFESQRGLTASLAGVGGSIHYGAQIAAAGNKAPVLGDIPALGQVFRGDAVAAKRKIQALPEPLEVQASEEPFSTFSLHVSDVSFRLAQAAMDRGQLPDADLVRPEEFYNGFDYGDAGPATGEKISCHIEQCAHPFLQQRNLVRIAMKVAASGRGASQPLRLTVLLDTSGSMEREDRAASIHRAFEVLASLLGPNDTVTLIGFARQPRLLAEEVAGADARKLAELVAHTPSEGGTNLEEALKLGGEMARRHYLAAAQNRIVLLTDGAANLGNADPGQLGAMIAKLRQGGIAFDACGVGAEGYNDDILEALTRKGDGRYYFLNSPEDADAGFARQLAGALHPAAQNVKMQVRFNPARVGRYRLIGFEKHRLNTEDFRNDKVAAAELAAEEAAVAVYQVEVLPGGEGELGDVFVRFRDPADGNVVERSWTMSYDQQVPAFDRATPPMQLAGTAALLAEKLRGGQMGNLIDLDALAPVVNRLRGFYAAQPQVQELVKMFGQVRRLQGKR